MLVWDTALNRFAEFGSNQEIAKAAREGLETDRQLCYVAFDILYAGDTSVIHQSLTVEILIPTGGLNARRPSDEPCWSIIAHNLEDVEKFFKDTIENRDEGIILKDLDSKWEPGDRNGKWLKLKPDYIHAGADLDVIIIGGYYGAGRRGGEVAQFLVGLAVPSDDNSYPKRFLSFCRVGTGLSDEERDALVTKLKPYFRSGSGHGSNDPFPLQIEHPPALHKEIASYEISAPRQKQAIMKKCTPRRAPVEVVNPSSPASNTRSKKKLQLE